MCVCQACSQLRLSSTVLPPMCDHYCYSCTMWMADKRWEDHKTGVKHKKNCRANWARMVLTLQELAEEAQEQLIIDYLIAASLSKAKSKFVAKYKPKVILIQDDNTCRECKHPIGDICLALKKQLASSRS